MTTDLHPDPEEEESSETPRHIGDLLGVGGLLRAWRTAAGARRGSPITQKEVAKAAGKSERWYRDFESGAVVRTLTRQQCDAIATRLGLDHAQRHALLVATIGGSFCQIEAEGSPRISPELRLLLDRQMPSPAWVTTAAWDVLAANGAAGEWFPWITKPGANVMQWLLLDPAARDQHEDWHRDATVYARILRGASVARPRDPTLRQLVADVLGDPNAHDVWEPGVDAAVLGESRDGDRLRLRVPILGSDPVDAVIHVLYPAGWPDCRMTVLTWAAGSLGASALA